MRARTISVYERATGKHYPIKVAKNQKVIQIHRVKSGINFAANYEAMKALTSNAYVLYMYLIMHSENRVWALSSKDVFEKTHLTEKTYPKAVQELINKNYLTAGEIYLGLGDTKWTEEAYHLWEAPSLKPPEEENLPF
jgi:hypothetical protein